MAWLDPGCRRTGMSNNMMMMHDQLEVFALKHLFLSQIPENHFRELHIPNYVYSSATKIGVFSISGHFYSTQIPP